MSQIPNWFANDGQKNFLTHLDELRGRPVRCLQIGAYTGDASVWLYDQILINSPESVLVDVDTWEGSEEPSHYDMDWNTVEAIYDFKTKPARDARKIVKFKGTSDYFFQNNREKYDFIYIDGDHTAYGVLKDAVSAYEVLKIGGILAFDDYRWSAGLGEIKEPKLAIDSFERVYQDRMSLIFKDYQCWFRKVC